jgi:hypothetical protein
MHAPLIAAPHPSAASDLVRLAIPVSLIAASIIAALWIERGSMAAADEASGATPAPSAQGANP